MTDIGAIPINPRLSGRWNLPEFPDQVQCNNRLFQRSTTWAWPYPNVVAQYREAVDRDAMHMLIYADGHFEIDHLDEANPDRGLVLEHAVRDVAETPVGRIVTTAAVVLGLVLAGLGISVALGAASRQA